MKSVEKKEILDAFLCQPSEVSRHPAASKTSSTSSTSTFTSSSSGDDEETPNCSCPFHRVLSKTYSPDRRQKGFVDKSTTSSNVFTVRPRTASSLNSASTVLSEERESICVKEDFSSESPISVGPQNYGSFHDGIERTPYVCITTNHTPRNREKNNESPNSEEKVNLHSSGGSSGGHQVLGRVYGRFSAAINDLLEKMITRNESSSYRPGDAGMDFSAGGGQRDRRLVVMPSTPSPHRAVRGTIFSEDFVRHLARGKMNSRVDVESILSSTTGWILQLVIFCLMIVMLGLTPLIKETALWDYTEKKKNTNFIPQSPYVFHFSCSVVLSNLIAYWQFGKIGVKDCWNTQSIFYVSRVSVLYAIGETMEMFTLLFMDSTTWKILNQLKLPLTAILNYILLHRKQTGTQCSLIVSISLSILGYCIISSSSPDSSTQGSRISLFGIGLGVVNVVIVTIAGIIADYTYKNVHFPFVVLMAQGRLSAAVVSAFVMFTYLAYKGQLGESFFHGWDARVVLLTFWLLGKDWSVTFVLKNLDSLWKAIGTAAGLCVTYVVAKMCLSWAVEPSTAVLVLAVVVNIVGYTCTKREVAKNEAASANLREQIKHLLLEKESGSS